VIVDWTDEFQRQLDGLEELAEKGDPDAVAVLELIYAELELLTALNSKPIEDSKNLMRVRQKREYEIWRVSHKFAPNHAVRTIVWFPDSERALIALFASDKASMGDVFYDSVGLRADQLIKKFINQHMHGGK